MIPYEFDAERFSRWMSYALRHNPTRYGLTPDRHGFVDVDAFLLATRRRYPNVSEEQLRGLIEAAGGGRFELAGNRLRARYGHSIPIEPANPPVTPPAQLYYGSEAARIELILAQGLEPLDRRMVHLSETVEDALSIARRKTDHPVVFRIDAQAAHRAGILFYSEQRVYLVLRIPPQFLRLEPLPAPTPSS